MPAMRSRKRIYRHQETHDSSTHEPAETGPSLNVRLHDPGAAPLPRPVRAIGDAPPTPVRRAGVRGGISVRHRRRRDVGGTRRRLSRRVSRLQPAGHRVRYEVVAEARAGQHQSTTRSASCGAAKWNLVVEALVHYRRAGSSCPPASRRWRRWRRVAARRLVVAARQHGVAHLVARYFVRDNFKMRQQLDRMGFL